MTTVGGPESRQVTESRDGFIRFPLAIQGMCEIVGRLWADRAGRRIVADGFVAAGEFLQGKREAIVERDVAGMSTLGLPEDVFGALGIARVFQGRAEQVEADRGKSIIVGRARQSAQRSQALTFFG
jgi:hypothetical protein